MRRDNRQVARDEIAIGGVAPRRAPAPGQLALVQAFVNTVDLEEGREELDGPAALRSWLAGRGLIEPAAPVGEGDLRRALAMREALRALLVSNAGGKVDPGALVVLNDTTEAAQLVVVFGGAGGALVPRARGVGAALGRILAVVYAAMADGSWQRLKACRHDACRWAFYDTSKNRSGAWCSMAICGNRTKTRAYRARRRGSPPGV
jgi:predicted RNA-binding Zn ribbon-like protein